MTDFIPWSALIGGALIGVSASLLLRLNGRVAGISGIVAGLVTPRGGERSWRAAFVAGLLAGGLALVLLRPSAIAAPAAPMPIVLAAGLLVGFGSRLGNGCTSGHGVCGLSRGSRRSLAATLTFIATGALAASAVRLGLGSAP